MGKSLKQDYWAEKRGGRLVPKTKFKISVGDHVNIERRPWYCMIGAVEEMDTDIKVARVVVLNNSKKILMELEYLRRIKYYD